MAGKRKNGFESQVAFRRRLWVKLLVAYLVPVAFIVAGIGYLAYRAARISMEDQLGDALVAVARTAANLVGRPRAVRLSPGDEQTRTYSNLQQKLKNLKEAAEVELIYLFDPNQRALVDSAGLFAIGEPVVKLAADRNELKEVFEGRDRFSVLFTGKDGRWYKTGFSPVWLEGRVAAAVGVDGSAHFFGPLVGLGHTLALMGALALSLVVLVTLFVSRRITGPVGRLAQSARAIGRGEMNYEIEVETEDEIGLLSHTLNEMRKSIQERDRRLQVMLSGIAHEVRNPLGGMVLFAGLLKEELAENPSALKQLDRINIELAYLSRVVNDFLDFARKRPLEPEEMDPREELEQIRSLLASDLERAEVDLVFEVAPEVHRLRWDRERMRRALLNLVRNAVQASMPGQAVKICLERSNGELLLSVSDQGCGIPREKQSQVFEPFFSTRQQGTGLGLALAKNIVEAHSGSISFVSEPEKGTSFFVRLPAGQLESSQSDRRPQHG